jgi:hypothetical protein
MRVQNSTAVLGRGQRKKQKHYHIVVSWVNRTKLIQSTFGHFLDIKSSVDEHALDAESTSSNWHRYQGQQPELRYWLRDSTETWLRSRCDARRPVVAQFVYFLSRDGYFLAQAQQPSGPVEGGGRQPPRPGALQAQGAVVQHGLHRTRRRAVRWVCRDIIQRDTAMMCPMGETGSPSLNLVRLKQCR